MQNQSLPNRLQVKHILIALYTKKCPNIVYQLRCIRTVTLGSQFDYFEVTFL